MWFAIGCIIIGMCCTLSTLLCSKHTPFCRISCHKLCGLECGSLNFSSTHCKRFCELVCQNEKSSNSFADKIFTYGMLSEHSKKHHIEVYTFRWSMQPIAWLTFHTFKKKIYFKMKMSEIMFTFGGCDCCCCNSLSAQCFLIFVLFYRGQIELTTTMRYGSKTINKIGWQKKTSTHLTGTMVSDWFWVVRVALSFRESVESKIA